MGKRSDFNRMPRDFYPTPQDAVEPLLRHLHANTKFAEPCAGAGDLIDHLQAAGHQCVQASDIEPRRSGFEQLDARQFEANNDADVIITNPPWSRPLLHDLIVRFSDQRPTWLLFDASWVHTKQAVPFLPRLSTIVSVGRVKWIPGTMMVGKDDCAWHLFIRTKTAPTAFHGRVAA